MKIDLGYFLLIEALIVAIIIIWRLMKKSEKQEIIILEQDQYLEILSQSIEQANEDLNRIELKGSFESDDEIGWFFKYIKKIQSDLNLFLIKKYGR